MRWTTTLALIFILISGGVLTWFSIQDQPAYMLVASMKTLSSSRVIEGFGSVFWQNAVPGGKGQVFGGWISFNGTVDARSTNTLLLSGVAGYDATQHAEDFQSADIITDESRIALRPHTVSDALAPFLAPPTGSPTGTWVTYQKDELLKHEGLDWVIASGTTQMVSSAISLSRPDLWFKLVSADRGVDENGHDIVRARVRPDADQMSSVLFDIVTAWKGRSLNAADLETMQRIARGMEMGEWTVDIDRLSHHIRAISGSWPTVDDRGVVTGRISMQFNVTKMGNAGSAAPIPKDAVDVTDRIRPRANGGFDLPSERVTSTPAYTEILMTTSTMPKFPKALTASSTAATTTTR